MGRVGQWHEYRLERSHALLRQQGQWLAFADSRRVADQFPIGAIGAVWLVYVQNRLEIPLDGTMVLEQRAQRLFRSMGRRPH